MNSEQFAAGFCACLFVGSLMFFIGVSVGTDATRQEALRRGFAEYSQQTGEWQWKEAKTAEEGGEK